MSYCIGQNEKSLITHISDMLLNSKFWVKLTIYGHIFQNTSVFWGYAIKRLCLTSSNTPDKKHLLNTKRFPKKTLKAIIFYVYDDVNSWKKIIEERISAKKAKQADRQWNGIA